MNQPEVRVGQIWLRDNIWIRDNKEYVIIIYTSYNRIEFLCIDTEDQPYTYSLRRSYFYSSLLKYYQLVIDNLWNMISYK